jgi:hypothetical protein
MTRERFALLVTLSHLLAAALHGAAHAALAIPVRGDADLLLLVAAVYVGPLVALALLLRGHTRAGAVLLSVSMAAALIYGLVFHYMLRTPDNVALVWNGAWGDAFRFSAALIAVLEALGVVAGALLLSLPRRERRTEPSVAR